MHRLPDGCFCLLERDGGVALRGALTADLDEGERAAALQLSRGAPSPVESALPVVATDAPDALLRARLDALGRGFAWHLAGLEEGPRLCERVREVALRARAFGSLTSLPLLPESAAGVALRVAPLADGPLLVHGGQLLAGVALALLGRAVTVWTSDEADLALSRALADEGLPVSARAADVLAPLDEDLRGHFALALVDTLAAHQQETALLSRALSAVNEGGLVVALVHSMRRPLTRRLVAELPVTTRDPLHEVAVRLHPGFAPAEFSWDEWVLEKTGEPAVAADHALSTAGACDLDPTEPAHGCVEVQGLLPGGITPERLDRALARFASEPAHAPLGSGGHDDDTHLRRYLALPAGGQAAVSVDRAAGVAAIDLSPWSPAPLAALVSALLVELPRADGKEPR